MIERKRLPVERKSLTKEATLPYVHKNGEVDTMKFYFTVGLYEDGTPGEVFIKADKTGSLASGALDAAAILLSIGLQNGLPLHELISKFRHSRFNPSGWTKDPEIPSCTSALDFLAQWLELRFPKPAPTEKTS